MRFKSATLRFPTSTNDSTRGRHPLTDRYRRYRNSPWGRLQVYTTYR